MSSIGVYAITLGGWASNNKYALLGGLRSSAQMISYELAMGLSTVPVILKSSTLSLVGIVLWGSLAGALLPFLLRRLGFDPATSSAPFVATLVDVTGLIIYFTVGLVVLRGTLL